MKRIVTLLLILFTGVNISVGQEEQQAPTVMKAVYFDISPPLRDMVQRSDAKADNSWKEGIVKNKLNVVSPEGDQQSQMAADAVRQFYFGDAVTDTTLQNFDGVGANGSWPPDTDGDVGTSHYFQVVNVKFAIYNKNGVKLMGPSNNSTIFNGLPNNNNDGDAVVLYDENADRWLFSQFSLPNYPNGPFYENVAISQTNDPTGSWYRYQFQFADMPDYPKLSVWVDGYYMTIRRFSSGSGNWLGPAAVAMERDKMLIGDPTAQMVKFNLPSSSEGPLTADCDSDFPPVGTPCPVAYLTTTTVKLTDFDVDWTTPANSTFNSSATLPIAMFASFGNNNAITQKGTSQKLDAFSRKGLMFRMPFIKFGTHWSMVANTTVSVSGTAGIRWFEMRNVAGTWSLYQEGTYAPGDGHHRWMGSIAMDTVGNIALGFSVSSTNLFPSIRYTGRLNGDPLGVMTIAEKGIMNGGGSQTVSDGRWGDYSAMSADPSEPGKFWYTQEYYSSTAATNWKTRIGSFSFSSAFSTVASASPTLVCTGDSTQLQVSANGGSGNYTYSWVSDPPGFTSTLPNPKAAPLDTTYYICTTSDGTLTRIDTVQVNVMHDPVISAGNDTLVCWYVTSIDLHGTASNYKALGWVSSGTGTFTNTSALETTYLPTLADKLNGSVDLSLIAIRNLPCTGNVTSTRHVTFDQCTGTPEIPSEPGFTLKPNPANDHVTITLSGISGEARLSITSTDGRIVWSNVIQVSGTTLQQPVDLTGFARGVYYVTLSAGNTVKSSKLVVK